MSKKKKIQKIVTLIVTLAVAGLLFSSSIWYIGATFQWGKILLVLKAVEPTWLLLASGSVIFYWIVRTVRWHLLLYQLGVSIPFIDLYMCSAVGLAFAIITPFQSGEMLKVELLKKYGKIDRFAGYSSFVVERVADLVAVSLLGAVGFLCIPVFEIDFFSGLIVVLVILLATSVGTLLTWKLNLPGALGRFQTDLRSCVKDLKTLGIVALLTFTCWGITAAGWYACLASVGVDVGYVKTILMTAIISLLNILSLVPGAVGVSEAVISLFLLHLGFPAPILRGYSIIILALGALHLLLWQRAWPNQYRAQRRL
jgi:uncharacterized protein (TIRG00374 family)